MEYVRMETPERIDNPDAFIEVPRGIICGRCGTPVVWAEPYQDENRILISVVCPKCQQSMTCVVEHGN